MAGVVFASDYPPKIMAVTVFSTISIEPVENYAQWRQWIIIRLCIIGRRGLVNEMAYRLFECTSRFGGPGFLHVC